MASFEFLDSQFKINSPVIVYRASQLGLCSLKPFISSLKLARAVQYQASGSSISSSLSNPMILLSLGSLSPNYHPRSPPNFSNPTLHTKIEPGHAPTALPNSPCPTPLLPPPPHLPSPPTRAPLLNSLLASLLVPATLPNIHGRYSRAPVRLYFPPRSGVV